MHLLLKKIKIPYIYIKISPFLSIVFYLLYFKTRNFFKVVYALHIVYIVLLLILSIMLNFINPPITSLMIYRNLASKAPLKSVKFIPIDNIPYSLQSMIIKIEDYNFYRHMRVDPKAIVNAYNINKKVNRRLYGGSTITQQLARTLFLIPKKTYFRKYLEIIAAVVMDTMISKQRILELYLNYIEWGKGIYGIGNASWYHYQKSFYKLTMYDYILLVTLISSPIKYNISNFYNNKILLSRYTYLMNRYYGE